ncbi:MAG: sigma-70 family RNA polymerase sigma factor [Enterobacterales bacterium]|nr:sigma-70 family RNA polymerase sigma factor [Enterobacterales bacterium]
MNKVLSDEQLILKYAKGDLASFEILYQRHKRALLAYCSRQFSNHALGEECFQEIWLKVIRNRSHYQPRALFKTYLYRIAQNHVIDVYRRENKRNSDCSFDEQLVGENSTLNSDSVGTREKAAYSAKQLRKAILLLPFEQRDTLLLKLNTGLNLEQIAVILDCKKETVKSRLRYATSKLKVLISDSQGENE